MVQLHRIWHQGPQLQTGHLYRSFLCHESHPEGLFVVDHKTAARARSTRSNSWQSGQTLPHLPAFHSGEAGPSAAAPVSVSASSAGESVGERLMYWSSRRGGIRGDKFQTQILHENTPREAEAPRRCVHTGKGLSRPST